MDRPSTPPARRSQPSRTTAPPTPELTRRIEESRLKAKALREQSIAKLAASTSQPTNRTPAGFIIPEDISVASRKRGHDAISSGGVRIPQTSRDARVIDKDEGIQVARKFKKYVDHDFSKMVDTRGGFLSVEDDPFNKAMNNNGKDSLGDREKRPEHMTLQEWERHQLLKKLRKNGQEGGSLRFGGSEEGKKCRECGSLEIDFQWEEVFGCAVCGKCKERLPERYSLLTKTEAKDDYLLTDPELKDPELLKHLSKPNPHKSHWHDMMLFLRYQVEEYAFNSKWGSQEALDEEFEKREEDKKKRKEDKFKSKLMELKKKTRTDAYRRNAKGVGGSKFGERIGGDKHEHEWGRLVENEEGMSVKTCTECGMEVEELVF